MLETASRRVHVGARVPDELARTFALAARAEGRSMSDALRESMAAYVLAVDDSKDERPAPEPAVVTTSAGGDGGHETG